MIWIQTVELCITMAIGLELEQELQQFKKQKMTKLLQKKLPQLQQPLQLKLKPHYIRGVVEILMIKIQPALLFMMMAMLLQTKLVH